MGQREFFPSADVDELVRNVNVWEYNWYIHVKGQAMFTPLSLYQHAVPAGGAEVYT